MSKPSERILENSNKNFVNCLQSDHNIIMAILEYLDEEYEKEILRIEQSERLVGWACHCSRHFHVWEKDDKDVKYCPFCGKKLNEKEESSSGVDLENKQKEE